MSRATEDQLAVLHAKVAETMIASLDQADRALVLLLKDRDVDLPKDIVRFLEDVKEVNPTLLTSATKFLKDNNISCDASESSELDELQASLKEKRSNIRNIKFDA